MDLTKLNPAAVAELIHLIEKRQDILNRMEAIDAAIRKAVASDSPAKPTRQPAARKSTSAAPASKPAGRKPAGKRGGLKDSILSALRATGSEGVAAADLAKSLGIPSANVHVWFSTTGKKIQEIVKVGPGRYAWSPAGAAEAPASAPVAEEPAPAPAEPAAPEPEPIQEEAAPAAVEPEPAVVESTTEEISEAPATEEPVASVEPVEGAPAEPEAPSEPQSEPVDSQAGMPEEKPAENDDTTFSLVG